MQDVGSISTNTVQKSSFKEKPYIEDGETNHPYSGDLAGLPRVRSEAHHPLIQKNMIHPAGWYYQYKNAKKATDDQVLQRKFGIPSQKDTN